jgi:P4 family phage/plasmid primase-like protien
VTESAWQDDVFVRAADLSLDDMGNAARWHLYEGDNVRRVPEWDAWYQWDDRRWKLCVPDEVMSIAIRTVDKITQEIGLGQHTVELYERHRNVSRSARSLIALANAARGWPDNWTHSHEFDANPLIFNVENCTLNLQTLAWWPHQREDRNTWLCPTSWVPDVTSPLLDEFFDRFLPDPKERRYILQTLAVAALSSGNADRRLILLLGPTSTGKSTFMDLLKNTLGKDYVASVNSSVFRGSLDDKPRPDLLRAMHARLLLATEASDRWELHADQIKRMTGGDVLVARGMRSDVMIEHAAVFTPVIIANEPPAIRGADVAIKQRLHVLMMDAVVEVDVGARDRLVNDDDAKRALLALLIKTYRECAGEMPIDIPERFGQETMRVFSMLDTTDEVMQELISEGTLIPLPQGSPHSMCVLTSTVYRCYATWLSRYGTPHDKREMLNAKTFYRRLPTVGFKTARSTGTRLVGYRLGDTITAISASQP